MPRRPSSSAVRPSLEHCTGEAPSSSKPIQNRNTYTYGNSSSPMPYEPINNDW